MKIIRFALVARVVVLSVVAHGIVYFYVATMTGYHEWRDLRTVQSLTTSSGRDLRAEVELRLHAAGWTEQVGWDASCFGTTTAIVAWVDTNGSDTYVAFDYDHHGALKSGNPVARQLFPDLEWRGGPYGWPHLHDASLKRRQRSSV